MLAGPGTHCPRPTQPPLSRAIRQLERRLGVSLLDRDRRGVALTDAGRVLLREAKDALDAVAGRGASHTAGREPDPPAGARDQGRGVPRAAAAAPRHARRRPGSAPIEVVLCEVGEQAGLLRTGRADAALMHGPVDDLAGFDTEDLCVEGQVAILPAGHPLALRDSLALADVSAVPDLPIARWPRLDGTYPDGPGPQVRTQSQLAQLVALSRTLLVIPASSRAWQWPEHVAVPVVDAPDLTTVIAWPRRTSSPALTSLVHAAVGVRGTPLPVDPSVADSREVLASAAGVGVDRAAHQRPAR